jgi:type III secretory pathway lipoprotein EscJ
MSVRESQAGCALYTERERADRAVALLAEHGIEASIDEPGPRYAHLPPGTWEVQVPSTQLARARALLNETP